MEQSIPSNHIENIDAMLDYRGVRGAIKCRLFPRNSKKKVDVLVQKPPVGAVKKQAKVCGIIITG